MFIVEVALLERDLVPSLWPCGTRRQGLLPKLWGENKEMMKSFEQTFLEEKHFGISIVHVEPKPSVSINGTFGIRFDGDRQYVALMENEIKLFIPFTGSEKICWDCGGNRELIVVLHLDTLQFKRASECCDLPMKGH